MPPRLSARALFWWGAGLMLAAFVATRVLWRLANGVTADGLQSILVEVAHAISTTTTLAYSIGAALIGAAFVVRALEPAGGQVSPRDEGRVPDVER
ncbi:hypothetical protein [Actinotalea sp. C106]|uniref:hypothetical protein n=1 Tax=Actinotalea sp. C106 TaxID=2908644 RepID=UPI0020278885|nr:hypothetical protein [Actinotalea sp. C106]